MKKHFSSLKLLLNSLNSLFLSATGVAVLLTLLACLASCRNELLEPPDFSDRGAYSSTDISAPEDVKATQGGFRSIEVSWNPVENAVKYEVYITKIATDAFEKRTETNGNDKTSVVIKEDADVLAYFKVKAYDKNGNSSEFSKMCHGTTLGEPIITNVIQDEFGKSATVRWWCGTHFSASTYKNDVVYSVAMYADAEGTTQIGESKIMEGSAIKMTDDASESGASAECTFTGLSPKTTYYYQVKAYLKGSPENVEASVIVDRETARRLIPNPVEGLEATQGISDKEVTLSFILPDFVDVKESSDVFLKKPLYFEISRAEVEYTASEEIDEKTGRPVYIEGKKPLTDYTVIATIKAVASSGWNTGSGSTYYFDCTSDGNNTSSKKLALEKTDSVESNEDNAEPYIPGYKLTFTDTTARRGDDRSPAYSYKVTSYADIEKKVTSDESVAKATGWLIGNLNLDLSAKKVDYEYADAEKKKISKITVKFSCTFEDYGKGYTYIVTQSAVDLEGNPIVEEAIVKSMDINELKDFSVVYDLAKDKEGYYSYKFYIAPKGTENYADAYYCYDKYKTKTPVVNSRDKLLEIEKFKVEDGYKDKFVIKWSYNPDFTYELTWTPVVDGVDQEAQSIALAESNENNEEGVGVIKSIDSNGMATFEHEAESGDARKYTIQITSGFGIPNEFERTSYTLGTAVANQVGYAYDTITIKWDKVQKADSYTLWAKYEGSNDFVEIDDTTESSWSFTPNGHDNAKFAGKEMQVYVTAKNAKDSTESEKISARLIGPAEVNARVNAESAENYIWVSWNEVEGANGYLIRRVMYSDMAMTSVAESSDITYYYDASKKTVDLTIGEEDLSGSVDVSIEDKRIKIVDKYNKEADVDNGTTYQKAQAKISWGLPFRYIVLPVLEKGDFDFKQDFVLLEGAKVPYKNLEPTDGTATWGYGLNLVADKATSGTIQNIKWEEPYNAQRNESTVKPVVYYRAAGSSGKFKIRNYALDKVLKGESVLTIASDDFYKAFEYIVKYCSASESYYSPEDIDLPPSLNAEIKAKEKEYKTPAGYLWEQDNKGYLFCISDVDISCSSLSAVQGGANTYAELITWKVLNLWNYSKRALGPTGVKLYSMNYNIDGEWHPIAKISSLNYSGVVEALGDDVSAENGVNGISLYPTSIADGSGTTSGALKVLRDYKHYYALSLTRDVKVDGGSEELETQMYTPGFGDFEKKDEKGNVDDTLKVFAYRQITNEELVRAATLAMSIGMKNSLPKSDWVRTGNPSETWNGSAGSVTTKWHDCAWEWGQGDHNFHTITFNNFEATMSCKSNATVSSFLKIDGQINGYWTGSVANSKPPHFYTGSVTVRNTVTNESGITITFDKARKDSSDKLILTINGKTKNFANITPLPYNDQGDNGFLNDNEEWQ